MKTTDESKPLTTLQRTRFGRYPKRITCQCNAEEMRDEVITIHMNERCRVCNTLYQVSIPKAIIKGLR